MRALKKLRPAITIVIITGYADNERIDTALREGAVTCLRKPFHLDDIRQIIAREMAFAKDRPLNILVVDDDQTFRRLFLSLNGKGPYAVEAVSSATEAIETLKNKKYDVCFIDIILPDFSGFRLYEECHNIAPEMNVVLFTGSDEEFATIKAKAVEGARYSLKKPFDIQEVRDIIRKIEESRR
jgi:DNA-binding NtrC family response regulator